MNRGRNRWITIIFWGISLLLFSLPIIGAWYQKGTQNKVSSITITKSDSDTLNLTDMQSTPSVTVHIAGAVKKPGIYKIKVGTILPTKTL